VATWFLFEDLERLGSDDLRPGFWLRKSRKDIASSHASFLRAHIGKAQRRSQLEHGRALGACDLSRFAQPRSGIVGAAQPRERHAREALNLSGEVGVVMRLLEVHRLRQARLGCRKIATDEKDLRHHGAELWERHLAPDAFAGLDGRCHLGLAVGRVSRVRDGPSVYASIPSQRLYGPRLTRDGDTGFRRSDRTVPIAPVAVDPGVEQPGERERVRMPQLPRERDGGVAIGTGARRLMAFP